MKRLFVFSAAALFLSACGDDASTSFTAASGTVTKAVATSNKGTMQSGAKLVFSGGTPTNSPSGVREDDVYAACTTKNPTTEVDADSDQIKTQTRTYACSNIAQGESTLTRNGTVTVTDKDDADANSGWKFAYDMTGSYKYSTRAEQTNTYSYKGFWELTKDATTITYASDYRGEGSETRDGVAETYVGGGTWSHKITPTDMTNPYTGGGSIEMGGFYAFNWTEDSKTKNYVFKMSSTGLKYGHHTTCTQFFKEGSYSYTDASNNVITYTFNPDCTTAPTVTYNTETI